MEVNKLSMLKFCNKCNLEKEIDLFPKRSNLQHRNICKTCTALYLKKNHTANIIIRRTKQKEYHNRTKEETNRRRRNDYKNPTIQQKIYLQNKLYKENNREKVLAYKKRYRERNKESVKISRKNIRKTIQSITTLFNID